MISVAITEQIQHYLQTPRPSTGYPRRAGTEDLLGLNHLRERTNLVPLPYRRVSLQPYSGEMTEAAISRHLKGREAYRRTDFVVLHDGAWRCAVVAIERAENESLFSPIIASETLALADRCVFVRDSQTDVGNRSALADLARRHGIESDKTLVVWGEYDHVNFIHHPNPLCVSVVEVAPPEPPKLFGMAQKVLSYADLPPIRLKLVRIDIERLCKNVSAPAFLLPCRSGGLDKLKAPLYFLDERPPERRDWVLVGCERSRQLHRHYYGDEPSFVEMCPRRLAGAVREPTLVKCCLLEFDIERDGNAVVVPWGADLKMIEQALDRLSREISHA